MAIAEINNRYSILAGEECCLSCGGAVNYSKPRIGEICLDLGSGRGTDVLRMADEVGNDGFVFGLDISDGMLQKAESIARKMGVANVKFLKSEMEQLPVETNSLDLIISNCTINHARNKQKVWNEIYRTLKNGGRFVISDIYSSKPVPEEYHDDPQAISECWGGAVTKNEYLAHLHEAGFRKIDVLEESKPYPKGEIVVCSFTIRGFKENGCCI